MDHRSKSSTCNVIFVFFWKRRFHSLSCGFVGFHYTSIDGSWNLVRCSLLHSQLLLVWFSFLHGMTASIDLSNFLLVFLRIFLHSCSSGSLKVDSSQRRVFSSFDFSFFHSCFSRFWADFQILVHTSGHTLSELVVVWTFVSLPGSHIFFWRFLFQ